MPEIIYKAQSRQRLIRQIPVFNELVLEKDNMVKDNYVVDFIIWFDNLCSPDTVQPT